MYTITTPITLEKKKKDKEQMSLEIGNTTYRCKQGHTEETVILERSTIYLAGTFFKSRTLQRSFFPYYQQSLEGLVWGPSSAP